MHLVRVRVGARGRARARARARARVGGRVRVKVRANATAGSTGLGLFAAAGYPAGIPGPPVEAVVLAVADGTTDAREEVHAHV